MNANLNAITCSHQTNHTNRHWVSDQSIYVAMLRCVDLMQVVHLTSLTAWLQVVAIELPFDPISSDNTGGVGGT